MINTDFSNLSDYEKDLIAIVNDCIPTLERGVTYTAETLVPASLWKSLGDGERRTFGRVLAHLVALGYFPLVRTSPQYKMPVTYELI